MFNQLRTVDDELREGMKELAALTSQAAPDGEALARTRLKITRLAGRRRSLVQCAILPGLGDSPAASAARLSDLRRETMEAAVKFSAHLSRWTPQAIRADWTAYRAASADLRRFILQQVDREAAILYPLLAARSGAADDLPVAAG